MADGVRIAVAETVEAVTAAAALFSAYAASLPIDLSFQNFAVELAGLPGAYAPPRGMLLVAREGDLPVGCVALRPLGEAGVCEMKRLYVSPAARGHGVGRALCEAIIGAARRLGYREMRLDTLPTMDGALGLYRSLGFGEVPAYYDTPVDGTVFLSLRLKD
jgi:ribosomal protein S18 acetylase RimI-like enzyme